MERLGDLMQRLTRVGYNFLIFSKLKTYITLTSMVVVLAFATGCPLKTGSEFGGSGSATVNRKLTPEQAQKALQRWSNGTFKVLGIKETPEQNSATADFTVDITYHDTGRTYNGPGVAVFSFYNDGRVVMTQVIFSQEIMGVYKTNVAVE